MPHNGGISGVETVVGIEAYYGQFLLNFFKQAQFQWVAINSTNTNWHGYFDDNGNPTQMPDGVGAYWQSAQAYIGGGVGQKWRLEYPTTKTFTMTAASDVTFSGPVSIQSSPTVINEYTITGGVTDDTAYDVPYYLVAIRLTAMADGLWPSEFKLYRYEDRNLIAGSGATSKFAPAFLDMIDGIGSLRNMDHNNINSQTHPSRWEDRKVEADGIWASQKYTSTNFYGAATQTLNRYEVPTSLGSLYDGQVVRVVLPDDPVLLTVATVGKGSPTTLNFTGNHGLTTGAKIVGALDRTGGGAWVAAIHTKVNGTGLPPSFTVTVTDADSLTIPVDSTAFADPTTELGFHPIIELSDGVSTKQILSSGLSNQYVDAWHPNVTGTYPHESIFIYDAEFDVFMGWGNSMYRPGVPYETFIELCNYNGSHPEIVIPYIATDGFITSLATMVKANLDTGLIPDFEIGNEIWNFANSSYAASMSIKYYDTDSLHYGYAARVKEVSQLIDAVFGNDRPWTMSMAVQGGTSPPAARLEGNAEINGGSAAGYPINYCSHFKIAPYPEPAWHYYANADEYVGWPEALANYQGTAAQKDAAFEWFTNECITRSLTTFGSHTLDWWVESAVPMWTAAQANPEYVGKDGTGIGLRTYECNYGTVGPDNLDGGFSAGDVTIIQAFHYEWLNSYWAARFTTLMLNRLQQAGVERITVFALAQPVHSFGNWGLQSLNKIVNTTTPRFQAFKDFNAGRKNIKSKIMPFSVPVNTVAPTIAGIPAVGVASVCNPGTWSAAPAPTLSYQHKIDGVNVGTNQASYTPVLADDGKVYTCVVTATNTQGSANATATARALVGHVAATFNPADKAALILLSNGNLTATKDTSGTSFEGIRATKSASAGKKYFELSVVNVDARGSYAIGFGNSSALLSNYLGVNNNSFGYFLDARTFLNNVQQGSIMNSFEGDIIGVAIDFDAELIWFRRNSGDWNNDVIANQNPATGTGGKSFATMAAGPYYPMFNCSIADEVATANFGVVDFTYTPPSGFGLW